MLIVHLGRRDLSPSLHIHPWSLQTEERRRRREGDTVTSGACPTSIPGLSSQSNAGGGRATPGACLHTPLIVIVVVIVVFEDETWSSGCIAQPAVVAVGLVARSFRLVAGPAPLVAGPAPLVAGPAPMVARALRLVARALRLVAVSLVAGPLSLVAPRSPLLLGGDEVYDGRDDGAVLGLPVVPVHRGRVADLLLQQDVQLPLKTLCGTRRST